MRHCALKMPWYRLGSKRQPERQSIRMSKITNDGLTRSGTGCFIAVPIWQQWVPMGWFYLLFILYREQSEWDISAHTTPTHTHTHTGSVSYNSADSAHAVWQNFRGTQPPTLWDNNTSAPPHTHCALNARRHSHPLSACRLANRSRSFISVF